MVLVLTMLPCCERKKNEKGPPIETSANKSVKDHLGRIVEVPREPRRIVSLHPLSTQILFCLNSQDKIVGMDTYSHTHKWAQKIFPGHENVETLTIGIGEVSPNVETIASLHPDILIQGAYIPELVDNVSEVATVVAFDFHSRSTIEAVDLIGKAVGKEKEAKELIDYLTEKRRMITDAASRIPSEEKKLVVYFSGPETARKIAGNQAYQHSLIEQVGGINVGKDLPVIWELINIEDLLLWDPDCMFTIVFSRLDLSTLKNDPVLGSLKLAREEQFHIMPEGEYSSAVNAPEGIIGLEFMAKSLYPDKFPDLDMEEEIKDFYKLWYRYELTDAEVKDILYPGTT